MSRMSLPQESAVKAAQDAATTFSNVLERIPKETLPTTVHPATLSLLSVAVGAFKSMRSGQGQSVALVRARLQRLIRISRSLASHFTRTSNHRIDVDSISTVCSELPKFAAIVDKIAAYITPGDDKDALAMQAQAAYNTVVGLCGIIQDSYEAEEELEPETPPAPAGGGQTHGT